MTTNVPITVGSSHWAMLLTLTFREYARYDHSEPQAGKDICDRILCPSITSIRRYCNEGHDVVSAKDMHNTLKKRPVRGTTGSVCIVQEQNSTLEISKIANFNNLHNVEFTQ